MYIFQTRASYDFPPYNARRQLYGARMGPVRARMVCVRVPYGPAGMFAFIGPIRDPNGLIQHRRGPARSPYVLYLASIII